MRTAPHATAVVALLFASACSDYDLYRPSKDAETPLDDTAPIDEDAPDIEVSPSAIEFGSILRGCTGPTETVTVRNVGQGVLDLTDIRIEGGGSSAFAHTGQLTTLGPGESTTFDVTFTPNAWTAFNVNVVVSSNDPDEPDAGVGLSGVGAEDQIFEESFQQDYFSSVDVLWVVDNSGSMSDALNQVQTNFSHFINEFVNLGLDYHLGVVTTDMDDPQQSGRLMGSVTFIDETHPNPNQAFLDAVTQGSNGSGSERGFLATQTALTEPLLSGYNAGFLRADAALAVIIVTDEDDDSDTLTPNNFSPWFNGLKADPTMATFSAICGGPELFGCSDPFGSGISATGAPEYVQATEMTGGIWQSICTTDFDVALQHLSLTAAGMDFEFPLTHTPSNIGQTTVTVDGSAVAYYNGRVGWTYNVNANSVVFHGDSIPGPGADIVVTYPVAGDCIEYD